jgi:hypothetical protein
MTSSFLRGEVWVHITSLTPQRFIEVPVPGQESERSCKCMLEESITTLSTILVLGFWNCSDSVEFAFCFFAFFCFCFVFVVVHIFL